MCKASQVQTLKVQSFIGAKPLAQNLIGAKPQRCKTIDVQNLKNKTLEGLNIGRFKKEVQCLKVQSFLWFCTRNIKVHVVKVYQHRLADFSCLRFWSNWRVWSSHWRAPRPSKLKVSALHHLVKLLLLVIFMNWWQSFTMMQTAKSRPDA